MKHGAVSLLIHFYAWLLCLYPSDFSDEFRDEMTAVFTQVMMEAVERNRWVVTAVFLLEIRDLPGSLLRQHWLVIKKEKVPMNTLTESNGIQIEERQPGTWGMAFLAGLPHLLMGLLIGVGK